MPTDADGELALPSDLPRGDVTLSDGAGALGPWRAHQVVGALGKKIADAVREKLPADPSARVLVVSDRAVLDGAWTVGYATGSLTRLTSRVEALRQDLDDRTGKLATAVDGWRNADDEIVADDDGGRRGSARPTTGALPPDALATAVDLLGLVRTDYTLTASAVTAGPSELATLTAAHLTSHLAAGRKVTVTVDVLGTAAKSPTAMSLDKLARARDEAVKALALLRETLAHAESELAALAAKSQLLGQAWARAAEVAAQVSPGIPGAEPAQEPTGESPLATLRQASDAAASMASHREKDVAPARVLSDHARLVLAEVDAQIRALTQESGAAEALAHAAARWDRLREPDGTFSDSAYALYVAMDGIAADVVTRRTVIGASGILRVLATGNASWSLLKAASGEIAAGGDVSHAEVTSVSLGNVKASHAVITAGPGGATSLKDPALLAEYTAKALIVVLALVLAALGVLSVLAVIRVAVR